MAMSAGVHGNTPIKGLAGRRITDDAAVEAWRTQVYNHLDAQRRQIRVLKLFPSGNIENDPEGELYTLDLIDAAAVTTPPLPHGRLYSSELGPGIFAALSYTWGDTSIRRSMLLNGRRCKIGKNAHEALRYLRRATKALHIWIDSICINQADVRERNQQVPLMRDIYSLACPVYIWTGPGVKPSSRALVVICRIGLVMMETKVDDDPRHTAKKRAAWGEMQKVTDEDWGHVATFANLPVWRRVWVQQEVILSSPGRKMALVVAGKLELNHFTFISGVRAILLSWDRFAGTKYRSNLDATLPALERAARAARYLHQIHDCWVTTGSIRSQLLFMVVQELEATDPKDYVYGMLGLLPYLGVPNYEKSIAEVYTEAMFRILERQRSLAPILGLSYHWRIAKNGVPSWARDWRDRIDKNYQERWFELDVAYNACNEHPVRLQLDRQRLKAAAYTLFVVDDKTLGPLNEFDYKFQTMQPPKLQRDFAFTRLGFSGTSEPGTYLGFDQLFETTLLLDLDLETTVDGDPRRLSNACTDTDSPIFAAQQIIRGQVTGPVGGNQVYEMVAFRLWSRLRNTRIAVSPKKQICILPEKTEIGDIVCILRGCNVPFVLRKRLDHHVQLVYEVVGGAYVHGVMDGEAIAPFPFTTPEGTHPNRNDAFEDIWLA